MNAELPNPSSNSTPQSPEPRRRGSAHSVEGISSAPETAKVMVVDDDEICVLLAKEQLKSAGYREIVTCTDAREAVDLARREDPDVILLDIVMPDVSGLEILKELRSSRQTAHIPVIFLTSVVDDETMLHALELGATDFLSKPVNFVGLMPRVRNAVVVKAHHDHLQQYAEELERQVQAQTLALRASYDDLEQATNVLKESHARAQAAARAKSEFLANMSHEIRTPMTAILGFSEILLENVMDREQLDAATTIKRNGEYLLTIINDILDLSKIEAGKFEFEEVPCSPTQLLSEVISLMSVRAQAKNLPLEVEYGGPIPESIRSDPTRLRQILINLIGNALKFTEVGKVRVAVCLLDVPSSQPKLQIDVIDTGIGMNEKQTSELFKPFSQVDTSATRKHGGTGLGLTISKRLAGFLGGDITVESAPGQGSKFTLSVTTGSLTGVRLIDHPKPEAAERVESDAAPAQSKLDCRVLLAEDGADNQRLIAFLLRKAGADVVIAENGRIACDMAFEARDAETPFDVILMDMQMPVMDGYEATTTLRESGYGGPVIALTAHAMSTDRQKCLNAGCDDFMTKPIDRKKLVAVVADYASRAGVDGANRTPAA